jgi:hypothetical protein
MEILSGALLVIEKATTVLKNRRTRRESLFRGVIEPIFDETEKIMANYHLIFTKLDNALQTRDEATIRAAAVVFAADRMEMKAVRVKVESFAQAVKSYAEEHSPENGNRLLKSEMVKFESFIDAALGVITNQTQPSTFSGVALSKLRSYLDGEIDDTNEVDRRDKRRLDLGLLVNQVAELLNRAEHSWKMTCSFYEQLKLSLALGVDEFTPARTSELRFWE